MSHSALIDEAIRCVEKIGYDKTLEGLKRMQFEEIKFTDSRVEFVVTQVSLKIEIPPYEIMFGNGRKNERKFAIGFCAYYLHSPEFFNIDMDMVKDYLNRNAPICYLYAKMVTKFNPKFKSDKKFIDIKNDLDLLFKKHTKK